MKNKTYVIRENEERIVLFFCTRDTESRHLLVRLKGNNASIIILGIFLGVKDAGFIFNTEVVHEGKNTKSHTIIRTVLKDSSRFGNDGVIRIKKGAKNANAYFDSKMLLFDSTRGRSVPSLEIDENEVKAGHGSTIGKPDENTLFYLRSRGLTLSEAEKIFISGFFNPAYKYLKEEDVDNIKNKINELL